MLSEKNKVRLYRFIGVFVLFQFISICIGLIVVKETTLIQAYAFGAFITLMVSIAVGIMALAAYLITYEKY